MLARSADLKFPSVAERVFDSVSRCLHPDDLMFEGHDGHYLSVGAGALNAIDAALQLAGITSVAKVLDFGCGAGRVTRWLCAAFPEADISVTDLRAADVEFCVKNFNVRAWPSVVDIDALHAPDRYDLIWAGSVLTHLPAGKSLSLLNKLIGWTQQGGVVVASLHGRAAVDIRRRNPATYLHESGWQTILREYEKIGYGYADYEHQTNYGISLISLDWVAKR
jgi:SAM-dependent methyltransferase